MGHRHFRCKPLFGVVLAVLSALTTGMASGQKTAPGPIVVATVGGEPIEEDEVARLVKTAAGKQKVSPTASPVLQAQALAELIDRRLVLAYARRTGAYPEAKEIDAAAAALRAKLAAEGRTLDDYRRERSLSESALRRQLAWGLVWDNYLARYLTDARVADYFEAHRREFDGTEIAVSHILLRPPPGGRIANPSHDHGGRIANPSYGREPGADRVKWDDLVQQAAAIRRSIVAGELSFADAAAKHSAGPSAKEGGKLGFIPRHGVMDEAFSRAAFALEAGQISEPVVTPFGVHLIRCDAIRPGAKPLAAVRKQLEDALARELLEKIARLEGHHTSVHFTGKAPYFQPGTRDLVMP